MTLKQIEKIRDSIKKLEELKNKPTVESIQKVDVLLQNFFHELYKAPPLNVDDYYNGFVNRITKEDMIFDIENVISVLSGMIASDVKASQILDILDLIDESKSLSNGFEVKQKYIAKIYYAYNNEIKFDKSIETIAKKSIKDEVNLTLDWGIEEKNIDDVVIEGVIHKLRLYAHKLLQNESVSKKKKEKTAIVINNNNTANATSTSSTSVDISIVLMRARKKVADEGLSDFQAKELISKINELEEIEKSSDSKGSKWNKVKEILKWLAEQGIAVAGILMPVITEVLQAK